MHTYALIQPFATYAKHVLLTKHPFRIYTCHHNTSTLSFFLQHYYRVHIANIIQFEEQTMCINVSVRDVVYVAHSDLYAVRLTYASHTSHYTTQDHLNTHIKTQYNLSHTTSTAPPLKSTQHLCTPNQPCINKPDPTNA